MESLDYRLGNRKPHAHAFFLGGEEPLEHVVFFLLIEPASGILHANNDAFAAILGGRNMEVFFLAFFHGIGRVDNQIQEYLLKLDAVTVDFRKFLCQL